MPVANWIEQLAVELLAIESELRGLVRRHHYDKPPPGTTLKTSMARGGQGITISAHEARTLLRAAMPVPLHVRHKRDAHAEMTAALAAFAAQLLELNQDHAGPRAVAGALDLADALTDWAARMRWHQATSAAGVQWPAPVSIDELPRQRTGDLVPGLFDAPATTTRRRKAAAATATGKQRPLLLPLPGAARPDAAQATPNTPAPARATARTG